MNLFDRINEGIHGVEGSLVNVVSALAPWGAPLVPAMLTFWNTRTHLGFPIWLALTVGFVVEALGLSAVRTSLDFIAHNRRYKANYRKAPLYIPLIAFGFYLVIIIGVNVALDWGLRSPTEIVALLFLTLLTVPAALIVGVRALHTDLKAEIKGSRSSRPKVEVQEVVVESNPDVHGVLTKYLEENNISPHEVGRDGEYSPTEIAHELGVNPGTVRTNIRRMKNNGR